MWSGSTRQLERFIRARKAYKEQKDEKSQNVYTAARDSVKGRLREILSTKRGYDAVVLKHYLTLLK